MHLTALSKVKTSGLTLWLALLATVSSLAADVRVERVPEGGLQPDALVDSTGRTHLVYLVGEAKAADIHYVTRARAGEPWSKAIRVNSHPGSAVAIGTVRRPRLALGRGNRVLVVWNGSSQAVPKPAEGSPLLFARLNDAGDAFEPQRNLLGTTRHLDGGAAVAANGVGQIIVAWHAAPPKTGAEAEDSEGGRGVYVAVSQDNGATFASARRVDAPALGVCACCALEAGFDGQQAVHILYRSAAPEADRGMVRLSSNDGGVTFTSARLDSWTLNQCPMTTATLRPAVDGLLAAWQSRQAIHFARLPAGSSAVVTLLHQPGDRPNHPIAVSGRDGEVLVLWTVGTGWQKGGELAWAVFKDGQRKDQPAPLPGIPVWGLATACADPSGGFVILH